VPAPLADPRRARPHGRLPVDVDALPHVVAPEGGGMREE
jgi:hypothetical protein